ncbi:MAG: DUF2934 domain-containing protein [Alphaproteobacteria bacterium]|nr:DUF2934 domain-containing protein [Alphaproteobacteria bacterium]MBQ8630183.1 DUF2934 domain-containing protein [Alphaproteobacteria bacterium]
MKNYTENDIRIAAYYNWLNNGCQNGTELKNWNDALNQLSKISCSSKSCSTSKSSCSTKTSSKACASKASVKKASSSKTTSSKSKK